MKKKLVVFDLDGTLLDTLEDIRRAVNYALSAYDIPLIEREETRRFVGHGLRNALLSAVERSGERIEESDFSLMYELMISSYRKHPCDSTRPYAGIPELLKMLEDNSVLIAVASNKNEEIAESIIRSSLPDISFAFIIGQKNSSPLKPDPEAVLAETGKRNITPEEIVFVGDSEVDYDTANNMGCMSCIVSYGFRSREQLEARGIENVISSVVELERKLKEICL